MNQLTFDEPFFPYRKESLAQKLDEVGDEIDFLFKVLFPIKWFEYYPLVSLMKYNKVHMGSGTESYRQ